jgi:hypothetical protein
MAINCMQIASSFSMPSSEPVKSRGELISRKRRENGLCRTVDLAQDLASERNIKHKRLPAGYAA